MLKTNCGDIKMGFFLEICFYIYILTEQLQLTETVYVFADDHFSKYLPCVTYRMVIIPHHALTHSFVVIRNCEYKHYVLLKVLVIILYSHI